MEEGGDDDERASTVEREREKGRENAFERTKERESGGSPFFYESTRRRRVLP